MKFPLVILFVLLVVSGHASVESLQQSNISTQGFTVAFTAEVLGSGVFQYGLTESSTTTISTGSVSFSQEVNIEGLDPATIYAVRGGIVVGPGDTIFSEFCPMMTASLSSGDIKVYFNGEVDVDEASWEEAISLGQDFPDTIIAYLDRAQYSLDIAIYNIDNSNGVIDAINAAHDRGVEVRLVGNYSIKDNNWNSLDIGGNKIKSPTGETPNGWYYGLMHNKFVIIDAESPDPNDPLVITGSTNFTYNQLRNDPNNLIIFQDQSMARGYTVEFEEMYNGTFGPLKTAKTPAEFMVNGKRVEVHFSPVSGVEEVLINHINQTSHDLYFGVFALTRPTISLAIANRVDDGVFAAGILVQVDIDEPEFTILESSLGNRLFIDELPWLWHHKYAILDPNCSQSDPMVYTGSANWSNNGNSRSDENIVVVHDSIIANLYYQEFMARYKGHGATEFVDGECEIVSSVDDVEWNESDFSVYPNPNKGNFRLVTEWTGRLMVRVTDARGKQVHVQRLNSTGRDIPVNWLRQASGLYVVQLIDESTGNSSSQMVIVN